jgi:hypothetical protein
MQRVAFVCLLVGVLVCPAFAQTAGSSDSSSQNVRDCLDGFETCNQSLLTKAQASEITDLHHDQNLWGCLTGYGDCDHSTLTAQESKGCGGCGTAAKPSRV